MKMLLCSMLTRSLQHRDPIRVQFQLLTTPLLNQLHANGLCFDLNIQVGDPAVLAYWVQPGPGLATASIWEVKQLLEDFCLSLSLCNSVKSITKS